jgi:hypothetical protein
MVWCWTCNGGGPGRWFAFGGDLAPLQLWFCLQHYPEAQG